MANENVLQNEAIKDFDFEAMEDLISQQLEDQIADLEVIKEQRDKIGTPESLSILSTFVKLSSYCKVKPIKSNSDTGSPLSSA